MYGHNEIPERSTLKRSAILAGLALLGLSLSLPVSAGDDRGGPRQKYQTANIIDFESGLARPGAATLTRSRNSVTASVHAADLQPDAAYSIWWVVWNEPSLCVGGCGEDDLGIAGNGVFWAGGFVTGSDGNANTTLTLRAGRLPAGVEVLLGDSLDRGNGLDAEMHLVIRSHGAIIAGMADVQIGSFNGACDINACFDDQAVVFLP